MRYKEKISKIRIRKDVAIISIISYYRPNDLALIKKEC